MKCYVFFSDDAIFGSMALPEESLTSQSEKTIPGSTQPVYPNSPVEEATVKVTEEEAAPNMRPAEGSSTFQTPNEEPTRREQSPNWFLGWKEVLHPSRLVIATGQIALTSWGSKWKPCSWSSGERMAWCQRADEELKVLSTKSEPTSPMKVLEIAQQVSPPPGFLEVMACLQKDPSLEEAHEAPPDPLQIVGVIEPTMATMSTSQIVKDKATGLTYMDTVTTSMGWVALSVPNQGTPAKGPIIEDITDLS